MRQGPPPPTPETPFLVHYIPGPTQLQDLSFIELLHVLYGVDSKITRTGPGKWTS